MNEGSAEGTVTVLFTDIEGSTDLGRVVGDHQAREIVRAHEEIVRDRVAEHGGRVVKSLGDGLMVAFSSARKAVACAAGIQRSLEEATHGGSSGAVPVRIGIHCGDAILEDDDIHGSVVNAAARITAQARANQVLVSEIVKVLVGMMPGLRLGEVEAARLKGFDEEWKLFEVAWREEPSSRPRVTPLVGRERERAELSLHLDRLAGGGGGLALIGGEPGVGKTRLAQEIAAEGLRRGCRVLTGRSYDVESPIPYGPFIELLEGAAKEVDAQTFRLALGDAAGEIAKVMPQLRNIFDDLPPGLELPPEQERRYLFNSIAEFVERAAAVRPLILILDDLHWADESSLALLETVATRIENIPILMLGTYRNLELDLNRPLARVLDGLVRNRLVHRVNLKRLSSAGLAEMLRLLAGKPPPQKLVDLIYEESEGNPFFIEEIYRHLAEQGKLFDSAGEWRSDVEIAEVDVPESIRLVVGRRLEMLAEGARRVLGAAAVLGRIFEYEVFEKVADLEPEQLLDALEGAERLSLVQPLSSGADETRFEFVHELIRQTLLSGMTPPRRQLLHHKAAEAIEEIHSESLPERAPEIANHLRASGGRGAQELIRFLVMAGERAQQSAAFGDAAGYFEEALALAEDGDERTLARVLIGLGYAQRVTDSLEPAMQHWRRALALYERLGDRAEQAAAAHEIVMQLGWDARWDEVMEITGRSLGFIGEENSKERTLLLSFAGVGLGWAGEYEQSSRMIQDSLALAEQIDDPLLRGQVITTAGTHAYAFGGIEACLDLCGQGAEVLKESPRQWHYATALAFVTISKAISGQFEGVPELADRLERLSQKLGFGGGLLFAGRSRMIVKMGTDPDVEAHLKMAQADIELCDAFGVPWRPQGMFFQGTAIFHSGDLDEALRVTRAAIPDEPPSALYGWGLGLFYLMLAYGGRRAEADAHWKELEDYLPRLGVTNPLGRWSLLSFVCEGLWILGEHDRLAGFYELMAAAPREAPMRWDGRIHDVVTALAAAAGGRWEDADRYFASARDWAEKTPHEVEKCCTSRLEAMVLLQRGRPGDRERAVELLDEARAGYRAMGFVVYEKAVEELLASAERPGSEGPLAVT